MQTLGTICPSCQQPSASRVFGAVQPSGHGLFTEPVLYSLALCEHCSQPFLTMQAQEAFTEDWLPPVTLWPAGPRSLSAAIPAPVRRELEEARTCFNSKAYIATAVMVGRALEGFCIDKGVSTRPLNAALEKLATDGIIDQRLVEWAHGLRALRNDGAHFTGEPISLNDARDALELAEALLDYVYVFAAKYEAFKERRARKNGGTTATSSSPATAERPTAIPAAAATHTQ
ncbi:DUF4145 domain-containing protein [Catellatospora paridis]|uniref:DUF4145 domain-containing protein n=1 Tax=Catellatospora paridis TaxID=1617086 RepID=UPI0018B00FD7|nr:DUF4145 domain-containing protein [Catellatospora paridis]